MLDRLNPFVYRFRSEEDKFARAAAQKEASLDLRNAYRYQLIPERNEYPSGWSCFSVKVRGNLKTFIYPQLRVIQKLSGKEKLDFRIQVPLPRNGKISVVMKFPENIQELHFEYISKTPDIEISDVEIKKITRAEATARIMGPKVLPRISNPKRLMRTVRGGLSMLRQGGVQALKTQLRMEADHKQSWEDYKTWIDLYDTLTDGDRQAIRARIENFQRKPLISIVMPVYNVPEKWLRLAIESVQAQLYPNWEFCIADDHSPSPHIRKTLEDYAAKDPRIKVVYRDKNGHISEASNSALALATGEYVALLDHDDELTEDALYQVVEEIHHHPNADLIYSDEDKVDEAGRRFDPHFKSDWNPDLFYSLNLITHLGVYRASILKKIGGFRKGFEGSQDYDLALRFLEHSGMEKIRHIPHVLYHWRAIPGSVALRPEEKNYAHDIARKAIQEHLTRKGARAKVVPGYGPFHRVIYSLPENLPRVSLVICTRDRVELLRGIVSGLLEKTDYDNLEVVIVDNQSNQDDTLAYFRSIEKDPRVKIIKYDAPFNFSAMNNFGVKASTGEVIGLLNNDLLVISKDWLKEMVSQALRPEVGIVGAKLFFPDDTVQHAGVILGVGGTAGHAHRGLARFSKGYAAGYMGRAWINQNFSAVTAACVLMRRRVFDEVGGLDETNFAVAFNDVDLCLKVRERSYLVTWTPYAELYHLESASRGSDQTPENLPRFQREMDKMREKWGHVLDNDPYYNPNLSLVREDFSLAIPPRAGKPWRVSL